MSSDSNRPSLALLLTTALLVAVAVLLSFYHYGKPKFYQHGPARLAAEVRQMEQQGAWLVPLTQDGRPSLANPPLYLWAARAMHWIEHDLLRASRIPAALCSVILILLTAWWYLRHGTRYSRDDSASAPLEGFALLAGLMVAASPMLYSLGREATPASMFAVVYLAAAFCWAESLEARRSFYAGFPPRVWLLWGYALAGVGLLVKGPMPLLLLWLPYLCVARAYHLRGFDPAHLLGLAIAFVIGGWWPLAVTLAHPSAASQVWVDWLTFRVFVGPGSDLPLLNWFAAPDASPLTFIAKLLASTLPWCVIAAAMMLRVIRREDRSPTLVYWTFTLLANTLLLAFFGRFQGGRMMLLPFFALLATDALYRWDFESAWSRAWRVILRISIVLAIMLGIFAAALLSSALWIVLFALIPLFWIGWVWHARRNDVTYSAWETTNRLAAMVLLIVFAALAMVLSKWERRLNFHRPIVAYFERADDWLDMQDGPAYFLARPGQGLPGLYAWNLDPTPRVIHTLAEAQPARGHAPIVFAAQDLPNLLGNPRLEPLVLLRGHGDAPPTQGMFRLLENTTGSLTSTPTLPRTPYHLALLGNSGTRNKNQREVGRRLDRAAEKLRLRDVLLLGNNIHGPGFFDHLNFIGSFEEPYDRLLRRGITFHALLGHEDYEFPPLQMYYPPFNMDGRRYYSRVLQGGLVEIFMLDAQGIRRERDQGRSDQLEWFKAAAERSTATWKIAALHSALLSSANQGQQNVDRRLAEILLPLFNQVGVDMVAWSGGYYYERSRLPGTHPLLLNAGWSGDHISTGFKPGAAHQYGYGDDVAGFVLLEFTPAELGWKAINRRGLVVDEGRMNHAGEIVFSNEWVRPIEGKGRLLPASAPGTTATRSLRGDTGTTDATPLSTAALITSEAQERDPATTLSTLQTLDTKPDDAFTTQ